MSSGPSQSLVRWEMAARVTRVAQQHPWNGWGLLPGQMVTTLADREVGCRRGGHEGPKLWDQYTSEWTRGLGMGTHGVSLGNPLKRVTESPYLIKSQRL